MKKNGLLVLAITLLLLSGCGLPKAPSMELVPFTSQAWSIRGLAPEDWPEVNPGHFSGGAWPLNQLLHEVLPGTTMEIVVSTVMPPRLGAEVLPEPVETVDSGPFTWDLYTLEIQDPEGGSSIVDLAMAETEAGVYVVGMTSAADEHEALREAVFLPAVEAVEPVVFDERDRVTAEDLLASGYPDDGPVNYAYFAAMGDAGSALHELEGTLSVAKTKMFDTFPTGQVRRASLSFFPGFSAEFFTEGEHLVPAQREVVLSPEARSAWKIMLSPGRVWSESGDGGLSRASFPFVLVAEDTNETHNGAATFLFDHERVSAFRFQVAQETAAWRQVDFWGQLPMDYQPSELEDREGLRTQFEQGLAHRLPVRPWLDLETKVDPQLLRIFNGANVPPSLSASGLVLDGTLYLQPCHTRYGTFPHCEAMRHGSFSVAKSMGAGIALLRLAEKYGEEVFDLRIADYVPVRAGHDGWQEVTFADAQNMATGIGDDLPERVEPNVMMADEEGDEQIFADFVSAGSAQDKADVCFTAGNYAWGPGDVARYNSCHTFLLSMAMDAFLKSVEGPEADVWDMVLDEVFRPIGIHHAPIMRTIEPDGSRGIPQFWVGLYPTADDVAKVGVLLQNGGRHEGRQLLHAGRLAEALRQTERDGLPTGEFNDYGEGAYRLSFWSMPYRSAAGDLLQIPYMSGFGGNRMILNPNGIVTFQFADGQVYGFESMVRVADAIEPFVAAQD